MASATEIRDLTKSRGDVRALDGIDLDVPEGSFFELLRPNGAGKTVFINILVGLARKTGGEASVFGYDMEDDYHKARDRISLAPREFNVDRFFPIHKVLEHKAGYHGIPHNKTAERADEMLKRVGIYGKRDTHFDWLSGGMKRRFMLAQALVTDPDLLALDEPTARVDMQLRHELRETVVDLNDNGTTILLTTHYIEEAERLCDGTAVFDSGSVVEVASPEELMDRGTDDIVVQLRDPPTAVPDFTVDDDRVEAVELDNTRLVATAQQGGLVTPDVVQAFDRQGHEPVDLEISCTLLEEVFVEMTRQGKGHAAAEIEQWASRVSRTST